MISSLFKKISFYILYPVVFLLPLVFLFTCSKRLERSSAFADMLTVEENKDLEQFFKTLLFENFGSYVLFGSKPLCFTSVRDMHSEAAREDFKRIFDGLSSEEQEKIEAIRQRAQAGKNVEEQKNQETSRYRGYQALKKLMGECKLNGFLIREVPMARPDAYNLCFINIQKTAVLFAENYDIFREVVGMDFHPLQVVFEATDPDSLFWKKVISMENHITKGLLCGYGRENSIFGHWEFSSLNGKLNIPSETYREEIEQFFREASLPISIKSVPKGSNAYDIPRFGFVLGDETAEKYGKERAIIESKYRNQNIVDVTLQHLLHEPSK